MTPPFADAARITPYPFAVHQVPSSPDNADASRTKKKRQRSRTDRNPHQEEEIRFNTGPVRSGSRRGLRGRSYPDDRNGERYLSLIYIRNYLNFLQLQGSQIIPLRHFRRQLTLAQFHKALFPWSLRRCCPFQRTIKTKLLNRYLSHDEWK